MFSAPSADTASPCSYPAALEQAWQRHLEPREPDAPAVISTFAGCGGSSLGYSMAGFRELLAVEWDDNAAATFKLNFPSVLVYHDDIAQLSVEQVLDMTGIQPGELDVFDGSPPCQGFSTAGKRSMDDPRNQLFREYVRLLRGLQPRSFVMENVSGMVKGKMRLIFADALKELKASGYRVSARVMDTSYFGVPQKRQRIIFIGVREDLGIAPSFPAAATWPITAREALAGLEVDEAERQMLLDAGQRYVAYQEWPLLRPGQKKTAIAPEGGGFSAIKWHPDRPARTVVTNDSNISMHGAMHWTEQRRFTVSEYKRFCSYPDGFQFAGGWKDAVARMGNSVPPLFMKAVAEHLRATALTVLVE